MKEIILISVILWGIPFLSSSQEGTLPRSKIYQTWVLSPGDVNTITGTLYQVGDSFVLVANSLNKCMISRKDLSLGSFNLSELDYNDIYYVKVRRHNSVPREMLAFALVGASVGAIIGAIVYEPPITYTPDPSATPSFTSGMNFTQAECAGIGAATGAICGIPVGVLIGLIKIKIPINGNIDTFRQKRSELNKYSYLH
ncbi:hypothetical protein EG832_00940 [bacterium]|nr:hypothetical protein [bacterium]